MCALHTGRRTVTVVLAAEEQLACAAEAARAPSVHNVQPACWRFLGDGRVVLFRRPERAIPASDPTGHDLGCSLGAAWEGMAIALSRIGVTLGPPDHGVVALATLAPVAGCEPVALANLDRGAVLDPDAPHVLTRRSGRAIFAASPDDLAARLAGLAHEDTRTITDRVVIARVAVWHDLATVRVMRQREQVDELRRWLRLSRDHPAWDRDGLTADAMALGTAERLAARVLLRWPALRLLRLIGADALLVSEAPQVRSAAALVAFTPAASQPPFERGRRFYRRWLALERAGLTACPMSATTDDPLEREKLRGALALEPTRALAGLWRVGRARTTPSRSPRLPAAELLA